ncbi:hypothetical protein Tco_1090776 [Tanacetum coccineum]|uniref:Uncharacterized protein n=1 Tax=Tanacetum coccineum TaxID=301880 RepID=A0ABQ5I797_9ASTR
MLLCYDLTPKLLVPLRNEFGGVKETDTRKFQPLPEVEGKGKEKVGAEQAARVLLNLQTPNTKAESMVSVTIHQDTFAIPPMTSPMIDIMSVPDSPTVGEFKIFPNQVRKRLWNEIRHWMLLTGPCIGTLWERSEICQKLPVWNYEDILPPPYRGNPNPTKLINVTSENFRIFE